MCHQRHLLIALFALLLIFTVSCKRTDKAQQTPHQTSDLAAWVDPFIGTDAHGHTYPGASMPYGMVQLSADTRLGGWDGASGYHYSDSVIYGFSHTALSGTGVGDYGDILVMPVRGLPDFSPEAYKSFFRKETEKAWPGYYTVYLDKPGVLAEHTVSTRAGFHRYHFEEGDLPGIIIDLEHRDRVTDAWIELVGDRQIRGMRRSSNWAEDLVWYFHMEFSQAFTAYGIAVTDSLIDGLKQARGTQIKAWLGFEPGEEPLEIRVGLSAVDSQGALANLNAELGQQSFEDTKEAARQAWNKELGRIRVSGGSPEQMRVFYTAMYHAMLQPNTFMDTDRRYRGMDRRIHLAEGFDNYTVFSLWDTYRTWHPLMTLIDTRRSLDYIKVMLNMYQQGGLLPVWELAANETHTMIGYHSVSVIADAWIKGLDDFDQELAMEAMLHSATRDHFGLEAFRRHGYIPGHLEHESVSKTLEYAYNDWCIAQVARLKGREDIYREYIRRAQYWKNLFDPESGFIRPKINGGWVEPFDPTRVDWHYTEANAWQYTFYVPHDINSLISMRGGDQAFESMVDELFTTSAPISGRDMKDITGLIGQYAHGNEPSHHMAYMYNFVGKPWKTQERVRQIMDELYSDRPDGLSGNEDCGQMSAWLIMSALGFYPFTPGAAEYVIGTPWFPEAEIQLENGNVFRITADRPSPRRKYIQSASLNGKPLGRSFIHHREIMEGGVLHFEMGSRPARRHWRQPGERPRMEITDELILPVPYILSSERRIRDSLPVIIEHMWPGTEVFISTDGHTPDQSSASFRGELTLTESTVVKAVAWSEERGYSHVTEAEFFKMDLDKKVELLSRHSPSYHGGGPEALIDGVRGADNWRLGGWQGYQGTDFEAIIDLGSIQEINYLGAGFIQDIRSWIWMPVDLSFMVSEDGEHFTEVLTLGHDISDDDYSLQRIDPGDSLQSRGRYVRVHARNYGRIPDWHLGAGGNAFIFVDEVFIR